MDIMTRINLLRESEFSTEEDYDDLCAIVRLFKEGYKIEVTEENGGFMITHMAAAFRRNRIGEEILPLDEAVWEDVTETPEFALAGEIIKAIEAQITNPISEKERKFFFLHICSVLAASNQ